MKRIKFLSILGLISLTIVLAIIKFIPSDTQYKSVKISNITIKAELANTEVKRIEGLIPKKSLPQNEGMLFIFNNEGRHGIWMMNMSFPIDIMWIDKNLKIIHIVEDAPPCKLNCTSYFPDQEALYVLEVNARFVEKNKIKIGDSIKII